MGQSDLTIWDVIDKNAKLYAGEDSMIYMDRRWSFDGLAKEVHRLAGGFSSLGVRRGDRIAVLAYNCFEYLRIYGAAACIGAILIPINWRLKQEEIQFIIEDGSPKILAADQEFIEISKNLSDSCKSIKHCLVMGQGVSSFTPIEEVASASSRPSSVELDQNDPLVLMYTAAVGGHPKGAIITHGNLIAANLQGIATFRLNNDDVHLNILPLYHIGGLVMTLCVMHAGGRNVMVKRFDPKEVVEIIDKEKVTVMQTFPPMLAAIIDAANASGSSLSSLRIDAGLEQADTIKRFQKETGAKFWTGFGQTETMGFNSVAPFDECPGSAGRQGLLARVRVVDDYDEDVPTGKPGEIVVKGPIVFKGYWGMEKETAYTFRGGWHHTGDLGRLDEGGYLWYLSPKAERELIKPGGENVYPLEVERVLLEHPEVTEACVFGILDEQWGQAIKAVCVHKPGSSLKTEELIEFVATRIARYKKPKFLTFVDNLPKRESGEIDREKVKEEYGKS